MLGFFKKKKAKPNKLVFGDHNTTSIVEVFGYEGKQIQKLEGAMQKFFIKNDGMGRRSQHLEKFIRSREFKETGIRLETPNDYFILGHVFHDTLRKLAELHMVAEDLMRHMASGMGGMFGPMAMRKKESPKNNLPN